MTRVTQRPATLTPRPDVVEVASVPIDKASLRRRSRLASRCGGPKTRQTAPAEGLHLDQAEGHARLAGREEVPRGRAVRLALYDEQRWAAAPHPVVERVGRRRPVLRG